MSKTDKELLELAAKAAGQHVYQYSEHSGVQMHGGRWNPLHSNSDAFGLLANLKLDLEYHDARVYCTGVYPVQNYQLFEWHSENKERATRWAITNAAASIGEAMP